MWQYIARKLLIAVPTLLAVSLIVFTVIRLIPGDPARILAGDFATPETVAEIRAQWGLDRPLPVQYGVYLTRLVRGDLGRSIVSGQPVRREIVRRYQVTVGLAVLGSLVAIAMGVLAGVMGATRPYTAWDYGAMALALTGVSTPIFWSGLLLILLFAVTLNWLPSGGVGSPTHYVLPAVSLGYFTAGVVARQARSSLLEVLGQDYVRTARAKGLGERAVVYHHALRNSLIPVITVIGIQFGRMLGGAILTETVFSLPGMGSYLILAIGQRDYPVVQGVVLTFAASFVLINLAVDMGYAFLDPRIRHD
ncbi:MAG: ABC transporter permease [Armatimonadetes bacterium]|nr:ABC transporter permease [Armatimonadota bacterium]